jgi:hypothetical protein
MFWECTRTLRNYSDGNISLTHARAKWFVVESSEYFCKLKAKWIVFMWKNLFSVTWLLYFCWHVETVWYRGTSLRKFISIDITNTDKYIRIPVTTTEQVHKAVCVPELLSSNLCQCTPIVSCYLFPPDESRAIIVKKTVTIPFEIVPYSPCTVSFPSFSAVSNLCTNVAFWWLTHLLCTRKIPGSSFVLVTGSHHFDISCPLKKWQESILTYITTASFYILPNSSFTFILSFDYICSMQLKIRRYMYAHTHTKKRSLFLTCPSVSGTQFLCHVITC